MVIDFHIHCFPDNLAAKAMEKLIGTSDLVSYTDGTAADSIKVMKECGVDKAVVCNIATNPKQQANVNKFAIMLNGVYPELIAFGSVHPDSGYDDILYELTNLKNAGVKGIKIHPEYMMKYITDDAYKPIFNICRDLDLIVLTHAGFDYLSPDIIRCMPEDLLKIINEYPQMKLIAAHLGGTRVWDDVEKYLLGNDIWFDLSMIRTEGIDENLLYKILTGHDPEKLLFATDLPWGNPAEDIKFINNIGLSDELKENIFYKNAVKLLSCV